MAKDFTLLDAYTLIVINIWWTSKLKACKYVHTHTYSKVHIKFCLLMLKWSISICHTWPAVKIVGSVFHGVQI